MCNLNVTAQRDGDLISIDFVCPEHGGSKNVLIGESEVGSFLDEGNRHVLYGEIPASLFYSVIDALQEAGVEVPDRFRQN